MRIPKKYGSYRVDPCPFCKKDCTTKNSQQIPVCAGHKSKILPELTCLCGGFLELKDGKFGVYFQCINCGNISLKKALDMNPGFESQDKANKDNEPDNKKEIKSKNPKEITVTSDEVDVFYS